jgi:hypothetical protein
LIRSGLDPWPRNASELAKIVGADFQRWKTIILDAKIQAK